MNLFSGIFVLPMGPPYEPYPKPETPDRNVRVRVLTSFLLRAGKIANEGDVLELPESYARYLASSRIGFVVLEEPAR